MINKARRLLIYIGKMLPFAICFILLVSYLESTHAVVFDRFVCYNDTAVLYTPLSWFIADRFEYDWLSVVVLLIISIAIETCCWNKIAVTYLGLHLVFKGYVSDIELEEHAIVCLCVINIIITSIIIYKGVRRIKL